MRRSTRTALAIALAIGLAATTLAAATPAGALDFSCRAAGNAAERTICADGRLASLDETMARVYGRLWSVASNRERLSIHGAQVRFLAARNDCGRNARCIRDAYLDQIGVLEARLSDTLAN